MGKGCRKYTEGIKPEKEKERMIRKINNDAAEAAKAEWGVVELYNNVMYYVMILLILVLRMLISGLMGRRGMIQRIKWGGEKGRRIRRDKSSNVEIIWTITLAVMLIGKLTLVPGALSINEGDQVNILVGRKVKEKKKRWKKSY